MLFKREANSVEIAMAGDWNINLQSGIVSNGEKQEIQLGAQLANVFYILLKNANREVSSEELINSIWDQVTFGEESLNTIILDLRKTLQVHYAKPPEIISIPNRGYRLLLKNQQHKEALWKILIRYSFYFAIYITLLIFLLRKLGF